MNPGLCDLDVLSFFIHDKQTQPTQLTVSPVLIYDNPSLPSRPSATDSPPPLPSQGNSRLLGTYLAVPPRQQVARYLPDRQ